MIYTVFPKDEDKLPQDFATYEEALEYAEERLDGGYDIESTDGEVV